MLAHFFALKLSLKNCCKTVASKSTAEMSFRTILKAAQEEAATARKYIVMVLWFVRVISGLATK